MNHEARDKAAREAAWNISNPPDTSDYHARGWNSAYAGFLAGYAAAKKEYEESLRVAKEHIANARSEASSVNISRGYIIDELCLALERLLQVKITDD